MCRCGYNGATANSILGSWPDGVPSGRIFDKAKYPNDVCVKLADDPDGQSVCRCSCDSQEENMCVACLM